MTRPSSDVAFCITASAEQLMHYCLHATESGRDCVDETRTRLGVDALITLGCVFDICCTPYESSLRLGVSAWWQLTSRRLLP